MNRRTDPPDQESLADLTDRLLSGGSNQGEPDQESRQLQRTVDLLARARPGARPDASMQARIRTRLADEWGKLGATPSPQTGNWRSSRQTRRIYAFGLAGLAILILIAGLWIGSGGSGSSVPGAAQAPAFIALIIFAIVVLILGIIWWWSRRKPK